MTAESPHMASVGATRSCSLAELLAGIASVPRDVAVSDVTLDSRAAVPGAVFLACRGHAHHGLEFARQAVANGARAVLYESAGPTGAGEGASAGAGAPDLPSDIVVAPVPRLGLRAGEIADRFFGAPSQHLTVAGITGTNGKTTCAYLLSQALEACGRPAAYSGTLGFGRRGALAASAHTTSDAVELQRQLAKLRALGAECVAMEVSSHALDQRRVSAVRFHTAAFTNLTRDHLDYHGTMERYGAAKAQLFTHPGLAARVINVDDPFGVQLARAAGAGSLVVTTRGPRGALDIAPYPSSRFVRAARATPARRGLTLDVESSWGNATLDVPLVADFNVENVLTVLAVLLAWDVPLERAAEALRHAEAPPGRMEIFGGVAGQPLVLVDYAHTPDALAKALQAARSHCKGRLVVVFGCGGDRDRGKRPQMGRIAAAIADELLVTDDNPRSEDPQRIVAEIVAGIERRVAMRVEHDRASAIRLAIRAAGAQDVVVIAGKGHEDYQIYGAERRAFSDRAAVREALEEAGT